MASAKAQKIPMEWFEGWKTLGIDMLSLPEDTLTWHEIEILRAFAEHGERRFWLEPIWDVDWNERLQTADREIGCSMKMIHPPPIHYHLLGFFIDLATSNINKNLFKRLIRKC